MRHHINCRHRLLSTLPVLAAGLAILASSCISFSDSDRGYLIAAAQEPVGLPFDTDTGLIILEATVNGEKGRFLFDNGFTLSAVNERFSRRAAIDFSSSSNVRDANNVSARLQEATVGRTNIGGQVFVDTGFYLLETDLFLPCDSIDGIIGASIINKVNWQIDFERNEMLVSSLPFDDGGSSFPVSISANNSTFAEFEINSIPIRTKIDFGRSGSFKMGYDEFRSSFSGETVEVRTGISSLSATGLGSSDSTYRLVDRYNVAANGQLYPSSGEIDLTKKLKYQAYVGLSWFNQYRVTINSTRDEYVLDQSDYSEDNSIQSRYPITVYPVDGVYRIIRINASDPITEHVSLMDEVGSIDGRPMDSFSDLCEFQALIKEKKELNESWTLRTTADDVEIEIPLKVPETSVLR